MCNVIEIINLIKLLRNYLLLCPFLPPLHSSFSIPPPSLLFHPHRPTLPTLSQLTEIPDCTTLRSLGTRRKESKCIWMETWWILPWASSLAESPAKPRIFTRWELANDKNARSFNFVFVLWRQLSVVSGFENFENHFALILKLTAKITLNDLSVYPSVRPTVSPSIRPSVRPSVCPSVRPSVRPSVHPSVHDAFPKNRENR